MHWCVTSQIKRQYNLSSLARLQLLDPAMNRDSGLLWLCWEVPQQFFFTIPICWLRNNRITQCSGFFLFHYNMNIVQHSFLCNINQVLWCSSIKWKGCIFLCPKAIVYSPPVFLALQAICSSLWQKSVIESRKPLQRFFFHFTEKFWTCGHSLDFILDYSFDSD